MVKKILVIFFFSFVMIGNVFAETYYENDKGVEMSEDEYNFISELYGDGFPAIIPQDTYNALKENNIFGQEIIRISDENEVSPYGIIETSYKKLTTSYACDTTCAVSATLSWKKVPATKSHDLFGVHFDGCGEITGLSSYMVANGNIYDPVEYKLNSSGAAATHLLPSTISTTNAMFFNLSFFVAKQGRVQISYQHAIKSISLANSRKYSFSYNGYGHVFSFQEAIRPYYDQMSGLEIKF